MPVKPLREWRYIVSNKVTTDPEPAQGSATNASASASASASAGANATGTRDLFEKPPRWDCVVAVVVAADLGETDRCPICLESPPVAPRLTRCGHIYCYSCVLRYSGKLGDKCPLCFDPLSVSKPVIYLPRGSSMDAGATTNLELMARADSTRWTFPAGSPAPATHAATGLPSSADMERVASLVYLADPAHVRAALEADIRAVEAHAVDEYCQQAVDAIQTEIARLPCAETDWQDVPMADAPDTTTAAFWFYQPVGHTFTYLSALDIRMLVREYGHYSRFPSSLKPTVERETQCVLDRQMRTRLRYLSHLPLGTHLRFLECDWTGVLSADTLALFHEEIEGRRLPPPELDDGVAGDTSGDISTDTFANSSISTPVSSYDGPFDTFAGAYCEDYPPEEDIDWDYVYDGNRTNWEDEIQIVVKQTGKRRRRGRAVVF